MNNVADDERPLRHRKQRYDVDNVRLLCRPFKKWVPAWWPHWACVRPACLVGDLPTWVPIIIERRNCADETAVRRLASTLRAMRYKVRVRTIVRNDVWFSTNHLHTGRRRDEASGDDAGG